MLNKRVDLGQRRDQKKVSLHQGTMEGQRGRQIVLSDSDSVRTVSSGPRTRATRGSTSLVSNKRTPGSPVQRYRSVSNTAPLCVLCISEY